MKKKYYQITVNRKLFYFITAKLHAIMTKETLLELDRKVLVHHFRHLSDFHLTDYPKYSSSFFSDFL